MKKQLNISGGVPCCNYLQNIEYTNRAEPGRLPFLRQPLFMQLLLPQQVLKDPNKKWPLVLFLCGGGYRWPKVHSRVPWAARLAERGFVVAMPEYRGSETNRFPAMVEDARTALRFLRRNADRFYIDPQRVVIMGGSAGGHIALLASYTGEAFNAPDDDLTVSAEVCGVIDLYGPTDITYMPGGKQAGGPAFLNSMEAKFLGCCEPDQFAALAAPTQLHRYIAPGAKLPPTLIAHGDADRVVPFDQSERFYEALQAAGHKPEFYCLQGADHADPRFFEPQMMDIYEEFIRRVIG